ncbi:N-6 DNA Methylase domain protein [Streptococcus ictaluri 707-05]|uniref:site-specific DNA-methyltransferase (adenine-specific) n=1 Tax=Streptococcus ictaluri 707-05 TaxID=764299 RepID=G5K538_9STRE|nr:N-6 DNA Methylase domain protein [Streptococcus ictaluri 707-05]
MAIVLPHGILFRGGSEGAIRQKLLEKNLIDTVIGLPGNLFTNTGIPVCVLILKKNRELNDPVLMIDASNHFIKVGKQNVLQDNDIARIVDTYLERSEMEGFSHLANRKEIVANDYNLNIPRYVESIDKEIPQDVEAHINGGIPRHNINQLTTLNNLVPNVLENAIRDIRPGYVQLTVSTDDLEETILSDKSLTEQFSKIQDDTESYIEKCWKALHGLNPESDLIAFRESMLSEIKDILGQFDGVDTYEGYQLVADIWNNSLNHDIELIASSGFYETSRLREPNMVLKGKAKEKAQDGWIGKIIPNALIEHVLFTDVVSEISDYQEKVSQIDNDLAEIVENAKVEDSDEYNILFDLLKRDKEGELQDNFDNKLLKAELKIVEKESESYYLINRILSYGNEKTALNKTIKEKSSEIRDAIFEKIITLTNEEADALLYQKWFGDLTEQLIALAKKPIKEELQVLSILNDRYGLTLNDLDKEISNLENEFELLFSELVVN